MYTIDEGKSKLLCKFSVGTGTVSSLLWKEDERILFCGTTHGIVSVCNIDLNGQVSLPVVAVADQKAKAGLGKL